MNIQISVVIWTVICFIVLLFVLTNLLFKPVLEVMDKRNKKIGDAKKAAADAELEAQKQAQKQAELALEAAHNSELEAKVQAEKVRLEGKKSLDEARKERLATVEEYRKKTDAEYQTDMQKVMTDVDTLSDIFLEKIFAN